MANIPFGQRAQRARIKNAWSQAELAEKLHVSQMTISNWENGKVVPDRTQKLKIKGVLGLLKGGKAAGNKSLAEDTDGADQESGPSAFGSWLNRARLERRMSVGELSAKAVVSGAAIYNIESGRIENPRAETVSRLEKALERKVPAETKKEIREEATVEGVGEFFEFDPLNEEDWPDVPGIYVFYDISERPIYVGQGANIRKRIQEHEEKFWFKAPIVVTAAYIRVPEAELRKKFETILIRFLRRNAVINKQNVDR